MARITPPLSSKGLFSIRGPFVATPTTVYHVAAIRTFEDIIDQGLDPLALVYTPVGLANSDYQIDIAAGAVVITLMSATEKAIHVPDTYIDSYPDMGVVPHQWVVLSISCGMLPDTYDTASLIQAVGDAVSDHTGVLSTVKVNVAPVTDAITQAQYVQNLNARNAAIKLRTSVYANNLANLALIASLKQSNATMITMIQTLQVELAAAKGVAPGP